MRMLLTTVGCFAGVLLATVLAADYARTHHSKRAEGVRFGDAMPWKGGTVGIFDYCSFPGAYDNRVEWVVGKGKKTVMLELGNSIPRFAVLDNGNLRATFYRYQGEDTIWVRAEWSGPHDRPTITESDVPFEDAP